MLISGFENKDYRNGFDEGYEKGVLDERPKAFSNGYERGYKQGRSEAKSELYTILIQEMAELNEVGMSEANLKTFAYRVKEIVDQLKEKQ